MMSRQSETNSPVPKFDRRVDTLVMFTKLKEDFQYNLQLLAERDRELEQYDSAFAVLKEDLAKKEAELSKERIHAAELEARLGEEHKKNQHLLEESAQKQRQLQELEHRIEQVIAAREAELTDMKLERKKLEEQVSSCKAEISKLRAAMEEQSKELSVCKEKARQSTEDSEAQLQQLEREKGLLSEELSRLQQTNSRLKGECDIARRDAASLRQQLRKLEGELASKLEASSQERRTLEDEVGQRAAELAGLKSEKDGLEHQLARVTRELEEARAHAAKERETSGEVLEATREEVRRLKRELLERDTTIATLRDKLTELSADIADSRRDLASLQAELASSLEREKALKARVEQQAMAAEAAAKQSAERQQQLEEQAAARVAAAKEEQRAAEDRWREAEEQSRAAEARAQAAEEGKRLAEEARKAAEHAAAEAGERRRLAEAEAERLRAELKRSEFLREAEREGHPQLATEAALFSDEFLLGEPVDSRSARQLAEENERLKRRIVELEGHNRRAQQVVDSMRAELHELQRAESTGDEAVLLRRQVREQQEALGRLRGELLDAIAKANKATAQATRLEALLQTQEYAQQQRLRRTAELEHELAEARGECERLYRSSVEAAATIRRLTDQMAVLKEELAIASGNSAGHAEQVVQLQTRVAQLKAELAEASQRTHHPAVQDSTLEAHRLAHENMALRSKLEEAVADLRRVMGDREKLLDLSNTLRDDLKQALDEQYRLSARAAESERGEKELVQRYEASLRELTARNMALEAEVKRLASPPSKEEDGTKPPRPLPSSSQRNTTRHHRVSTEEVLREMGESEITSEDDDGPQRDQRKSSSSPVRSRLRLREVQANLAEEFSVSGKSIGSTRGSENSRASGSKQSVQRQKQQAQREQLLKTLSLVS